MKGNVEDIRILATAEIAGRRGHNVLLAQAMRGSMCIGQDTHEGRSAVGLRVHFTKERGGGRNVSILYSVPPGMF